MKSFVSLAAFVVLASRVAAQSALTINSPASVVECEPLLFTWTGGTPPYYLALIPAGQPTAPALKRFPQQSGDSYTWTVDLQSGTAFSISLTDATGAQQYSAPSTVQDGTSNSCANSNVQEGGSSGQAQTGATSTVGAGSTSATSSNSLSVVGAAATLSDSASAGSATLTHSTVSGESSFASEKTLSFGSESRTVSGSTSASVSAASAAVSSNAASVGKPLGSFGLAGGIGIIGALLF